MDKVSKTPILSVAIPTYNGELTIKRTLECILSQEEKDIEIVIGDDCSQDSTLQIAKSIKDQRLKIYPFRERLGITGNWTRCIRRCSGKYVVLFGQDDEVKTNWAGEMIKALEENNDADMAFCRRDFVYDDEESKKIVGYFFSDKYLKMLDGFYSNIKSKIYPDQMVKEANRYSFEINLIGEPAFVIFRRDNPSFVEGFDPGMTQMMDWEFYTRFFINKPIIHIPKKLGVFHISVKGSSVEHARTLKKHYREYLHLIPLVIKRFKAFLSKEDIELFISRMNEAFSYCFYES